MVEWVAIVATIRRWWALIPAALMLLALAGCGAGAGNAAARQSGPAPVMVGIAASDGVGIGARNPDTDNWIAQLGTHLPAGSRVINLGIGSATALQAETQELPVALDAHPSLAVVWLGVNDYAQGVPVDAFASSLGRILTALHGAGAKVLVANLPDLRALPAFAAKDPSVLGADVARWNTAIATTAQTSGASLVDLYTAWEHAPEQAALISGDGLHPTTAGYRALADLFWQTMRQTGG